MFVVMSAWWQGSEFRVRSEKRKPLMTWLPIEERVREFLREFDFRIAEWDGLQLNCYINSQPGDQEKGQGVPGEPFGGNGFIYGSHTRVSWEALEDYLEDEVGNKPLTVRV